MSLQNQVSAVPLLKWPRREHWMLADLLDLVGVDRWTVMLFFGIFQDLWNQLSGDSNFQLCTGGFKRLYGAAA